MAIKSFVDGNSTAQAYTNDMIFVGAATGSQTIQINAGVTGVVVDANIERFVLTGNLSTYRFAATAAGTSVQDATGVIVATIPSLNQTATVVFADGSAPLVQTGGSSFTLGGAALASTAAAVTAASMGAGFTATNTVTLSGATSVNEGASAIYTVTLGSVSSSLVTVPYTLTGTTTAGVDFTGTASGTLSISAGSTSTTLTLPVAADSLTDGAETIIVTLGTPSSGFTVVSGQGTVTTTVADTSLTVAGQTFSLTTGIDNITGTAGNDLIQGLGADLTALDAVNGGAGIDTLFLSTVAAAATLSSVNITNIETLKFSSATAAHTATLAGLTGITTVENVGSSVALIVGAGASSLATVGAVKVSGAVDNATTVVYQEAAVTGSTDAVTVTVNNATAAGTINIDTQTATATVAGAIETVNLVSEGSVANSITLVTNDTQGMGTLNISGSAAVTVAMSGSVTTDVIVINAASATGNVTVSAIGAGNNFAGTAVGHTITGGTGNDTFVLGANYIGAEATVASGTRDIIDGGAGTDTVSMTIARAVAASTTAQANLTNVEGLTISDTLTSTTSDVNVTRFTGVTAVNLSAAISADYAGTMTINSGTSVTIAANAIANSAATFLVGGTGVADSMTLNTAGLDFLGTGAETFTGIETLNINTGTTVVDATVFANVTTMTASAGGTTGIVATGVNALTFTGVVTAGSIDASALTGVLTVTATPANAINIKGGSAADVITGSAAADLITGNNGADAITSGTGADSIILTETVAAVDTITTTIGAAYTTAAADTITGFTTSSTGDILQIDISDSTATGTGGIVAAGDASTAIAGNLSIKAMTAGTGITLAATDEIVVISGTLADATALMASIGTGAGIITKSAANTATRGLLVAWSDGSNTHISKVSDAGADAAMTTADLAVVDLVVLTGVLTGFDTVNFVAVA